MKHRAWPKLAALLASLALLSALVPLGAAHAAPINLGLNRPVTSSGSELAWTPDRVFDGDTGPEGTSIPPDVHNNPDASRWSGLTDTPWIAVDLGAEATIDTVEIRWGNTFATNYTIQGSKDGATWTDLATNVVGLRSDWVTSTLNVSGHRHVKVQVNSKSATWPIAIWEIEVMGTLDGEIVEPLKVDVIPKPVSATEGEAAFTVDAATAVVASGAAAPAADFFAQALRASSGHGLPVVAENRNNAVSFTINAELTDLPGSTDEGYSLTVTPEGVSIEAPKASGLFYGAQTLLQLLGPWARSATPVAQDWTVPAVDITDGPRYEYRGFMLDVSRSFMPKDEVKEILDEMAAHKLNVLHWHLSDDQGWRIAISNEGRVEGDDIDYTLLAEKSGATAVATTQWTQITGRTGYYTADDFAELVRYAADRHIAVVPEIDGPAHSNSILHAIPQLNSAGSYPKPAAGESTTPALTDTSVGESSLDANNPATYTLLRHVFSQLIEQNSTLVNGQRYLHIGGDESFHTSNEDYLRYMDETAQLVSDLDSIPMVWNEAANHAPDQLPNGSVIQHWVGGVSETARTLVNTRGMKMILSPAAHAYLPQRPGAELLGPSWACGGGGCDISRFYNWDPTAYAGVPEESVLGPTAPIWSEHIRSLNSMEYLLYPRLMATAEVGWTPQSERVLADFRERVTTLGTALTVSGRNFYPGDGTWELDVRGRALPALQEEDSLGLVGWASLPKATAADVTATLQVGDDVLPLTVTAERPYLDGAGADFDHRQVNSIFELSSSATLPAGSHTGTISVTAGGVTQTATVPLTVEDEPVASPSPSPSPSPSQSPTPTKSPTPSKSPSVKPTATPSADRYVPTVPYTKPGTHQFNGRQWMTTCEPYSQTERCRTEIWATVVKMENGQFVRESGWAFNNLTYLPYMTRQAWKGNPLGYAGEFTSAGRQWRTECDTAATGRGACRSYTMTTVYAATPKAAGGYAFSQSNQWVFNNIVMFGGPEKRG